MKIPLDLPRGAAWPVVAQIAALSQRAAGCTASIGYLAERLGLHPSTVYEALQAAAAWLITDTSARVTRRYLAPLRAGTPWARISYRAAACVGCRSVNGRWTPRRNRSILLELYAHLRRDEDLGRVRSQGELARELRVTDRTLRTLLHTLEGDGWISSHRMGRRITYRTHDTPLRAVPSASSALDSAPSPRKSGRDDLGNRGEMISETGASKKQDDQSRLAKHDAPPAAGAPTRSIRAGAGSAVALTRRMDQSDATESADRQVRREQVSQVYQALPVAVRSVICAGHAIRRIRAAIRHQLESRTAEELCERVTRRWRGGEWERKAIADPVAVAITLVRRRPCANLRCEDGWDLDTSRPCRVCAEQRPALHHPPQAFMGRSSSLVTVRSSAPPNPPSVREQGIRRGGGAPPPPLFYAARKQLDLVRRRSA